VSTSKRIVVAIDDDLASLKGIARVAVESNYVCYAFTQPNSLLQWVEQEGSTLFKLGNAFCLVLNSKFINEISGSCLNQKFYGFPKITVTNTKNVAEVLQCIKAGVFDFIEKPFALSHMQSRLEAAFFNYGLIISQIELIKTVNQRFDLLTKREYEVCDLVVKGLANKEIAEQLSISIKTVKAHRAKVMSKLNAKSLLELVRYFDILISSKKQNFLPSFSNWLSVFGNSVNQDN